MGEGCDQAQEYDSVENRTQKYGTEAYQEFCVVVGSLGVFPELSEPKNQNFFDLVFSSLPSGG